MLEIKNLKVKIKSQGNVEDQDGVVLENINLSMESGKAYVLDGRNGSGKSSLLSAIMGHPNYEIVEGEIIVTNNDESFSIKNNNVESSAAAGICSKILAQTWPAAKCRLTRTLGVSRFPFLSKLELSYALQTTN